MQVAPCNYCQKVARDKSQNDTPSFRRLAPPSVGWVGWKGGAHSKRCAVLSSTGATFSEGWPNDLDDACGMYQTAANTYQAVDAVLADPPERVTRSDAEAGPQEVVEPGREYNSGRMVNTGKQAKPTGSTGVMGEPGRGSFYACTSHVAIGGISTRSTAPGVLRESGT